MLFTSHTLLPRHDPSVCVSGGRTASDIPSSQTAPPWFPGLPPTPNLSRCGATLHCAHSANNLWGHINNTATFKSAISSAQFHQNDAASLHATAYLAVLLADHNMQANILSVLLTLTIG